MNQGIASLGEAVSKDVAVSIFVFLEQFPLSGVLSFVATLMVIIFFVTSSDSGSMVVDMLCSNGNNNTPLWQRIYWAGGEGVVAAVLLVAGGLGALQTMTIASALPFAVILLIATWGLIKALRVDAAKRESLQMNVAPVAPANGNTASSWQERLGNIVDFPNKPNVNKFINNAASAAINSVASELNQHNIETQVDQDEKLGRISLLVLLGEELDFKYEVRRRASDKPSYVEEDDDDSEEKYYRAEVHLREGGQDYDVMGWSKEAVINDIVDQYHKHMHFLHTVR
jgi:choline/glycine/proline betaine transport protein